MQERMYDLFDFIDLTSLFIEIYGYLVAKSIVKTKLKELYDLFTTAAISRIRDYDFVVVICLILG